MKFKLTLLQAQRLRNEPKLKSLFDTGIFFVLLFVSHYLFIWWGNNGFYPFAHQVDRLFVFASDILFRQSAWIVKNVFHLNHTTDGQTIWVVTQRSSWGFVEVSPGCTSLKQWMHWIFIMMLFPGLETQVVVYPHGGGCHSLREHRSYRGAFACHHPLAGAF